MTYTELFEKMEDECKVRRRTHRILFSNLKRVHVALGLPSATIATLTGALVTIGVQPAENPAMGALEWVALISSWLVAALTAAMQFLKPLEVSNGHKDKLVAYDVLIGHIQKSYLIEDSSILKNELEQLNNELTHVKTEEPFLSNRIKRKAEAQLQEEEKLGQITD